jgi:magnesium transporter
VLIDCGYYIDGVRQHDEAISLAQAAQCRQREDGFIWVGIADPTEAELERLSTELDLHELAIEDARKAHQRPKIEEYNLEDLGQHWFVALRSARYIDAEERVDFGEIHLFLGRGYVVTVRHGEASALRQVRATLEARPDLLSHGPVAVMWGVLDRVVDDYEPVVAGLDDDIAEVEESVFQPVRRHDPTERIYFLRREVVDFWRAVHPLIAPLDKAIDDPENPAVPMREYLRDVADHARRVQDEVVTQREQLQSVLEANLALITRRQSEVVQTISAWAAIIAVPTLIASIYGMNFDDMPELGWSAGYPLALAAMVLTGVVLYRLFKRARWL